MKKIILIVSLGIILSSCNDLVKYNDGYGETLVNTGPPVILKVSPVTDRDTTLTSAAIMQYVIIQGDNLLGVSKITVNGMTLDLKQVYITKKEITLQIPEQIPDTITNKIVLYTPSGEISTDLKLVIPPLVVNGMESEYVIDGDSLMITGKYFNIWTKMVMFDDVQANFTVRHRDTLMVEVPTSKKGIMSKVKILDVKDSTRLIPYYYRDNRNTPITFEYPYIGTTNTAGYIVENGTNPLPVSGNYSKMTGNSDGKWTWLYCAEQKCTLPDDAILNPSKYVMKWEYAPMTAYPNHAIILMIETATTGGSQGIFGNFKATKKWKTQTVALNQIIKNTMSITADKTYKVRFILDTAANDGGNPFQMCIDNIRIVPKE